MRLDLTEYVRLGQTVERGNNYKFRHRVAHASFSALGTLMCFISGGAYNNRKVFMQADIMVGTSRAPFLSPRTCIMRLQHKHFHRHLCLLMEIRSLVNEAAIAA